MHTMLAKLTACFPVVREGSQTSDVLCVGERRHTIAVFAIVLVVRMVGVGCIHVLRYFCLEWNSDQPVRVELGVVCSAEQGWVSF